MKTSESHLRFDPQSRSSVFKSEPLDPFTEDNKSSFLKLWPEQRYRLEEITHCFFWTQSPAGCYHLTVRRKAETLAQLGSGAKSRSSVNLGNVDCIRDGSNFFCKRRCPRKFERLQLGKANDAIREEKG